MEIQPGNMSQVMPSGVNVNVKRQSKGQGQGQHPSIKGCCCKRSQCIKNYCDCYQSMVICSKYCRCVGCRNTEVRRGVNPLALVKPSTLAKRERAAAMNAKAAAAAAKAGIKINIHEKPAPGSAALVNQTLMPMQVPVLLNPAQSLTMPIQVSVTGADGQTITTLQVPQPQIVDGSIMPNVKPMTPTTSQAILPTSTVVVEKRKDNNIFSPTTNAALLECMFIQATEGEQLGLNEVQVGQMVLSEFIRGLKTIFQNSYIK